MLKKLCLVAALATMLAACSTQTFNVASNPSMTPTTDDMQAFFVGGIGQTQTVNAAQVCGGASRVAQVKVEQTFLDIVLGAVTGGIYSPRHAWVYCTR